MVVTRNPFPSLNMIYYIPLRKNKIKARKAILTLGLGKVE